MKEKKKKEEEEEDIRSGSCGSIILHERTRRQARRGERRGWIWKQLTRPDPRPAGINVQSCSPLRLFVRLSGLVGWFRRWSWPAVCRLSAGMILNACFDAISGHGS